MRLGETLKAVTAVAALSFASCNASPTNPSSLTVGTCDKIRRDIQKVNENMCIQGGGPAEGTAPAYHQTCTYEKARLLEELKFKLQEEDCK